MSLTIVLHKPGKPAYDVAKAYQPIGLLDTMGKLFSTLITADLLHLAENHQLLPPTQFGGKLGHCTTNTIHLVAHQIKNTWRKKQTASILFLDIQATFPNTVREWLQHNMKSRTQLKFDDYTLELLEINNSTMQGCPLSMLICIHVLYISPIRANVWYGTFPYRVFPYKPHAPL